MLFCHDGKMIPIANDTNATGPAGSWDGAPTLLPVQHEYDPLDTDDLMYRLNNDVKCVPPKKTRGLTQALHLGLKRIFVLAFRRDSSGRKPKQSALASDQSARPVPSLIPLGCSLT